MRGVLLHGRQLPANRSAGPARPPVVPAAVPVPHGAAMRSAALQPPHRAVPRGPYPRETPPAGVLLPVKVPLMRAPRAGPGLPVGPQPLWHLARDRDNDSSQPVTCTDSRICAPGSWAGRPAQARIAGPRGSVPRRHLKPCPPPISHRFCGARGYCLAEPGPRLAWLASTLPEPGYGRICVFTGNRAQPVAGPVICSNRLLRTNTSLP
jgi:hypothetical protein